MGAGLLDQSDLIDRIYECAVLPELWPDVLDRLSALAGARGGVMFANYPTPAFIWTASLSLRDDYTRFFSDRALAITTVRVPRLFAARHAGFAREHDIFRDDEWTRDSMYRDFLRPIGLGWGTGTAIDMPTGNKIVMALEREHERGPVEAKAIAQLDAVRPHLARSAFLSTRLALSRARAAADALAATGLPAAVFDHAGKVIVVNDLFEQLGDQVYWRPGNRIALKDRDADKLLQAALSTIAIDTGPVRSFVVRAPEGKPRTVAHLTPLTRAARDLTASCAAILVLTPVTMAASAPVELIQSLFDLTPAEARVARGIAAGDSVAAIATARSVSRETVRTHVRKVLEKTGCKRQTEVAVLLGGIAPQRAGH